MITNKAKEFFVNGHHCEIQIEGREHYSGWIDGEKVEEGHNKNRIRERLEADSKYRPEIEPNFDEVLRVVHDFVHSQTTREGEYLWVYKDTIINQVQPTDAVGPAYRALVQLTMSDEIEEGQICMEPNVEKMWRGTE